MLVDADKVKEKLAKMVEGHWNDSIWMTNQKDQAFRSAEAIRQADLSDCAVESQAAEIARLNEDAERYRWLADRVLACDYGDNSAAGEQIGWRIRHDLLAADGKRQPAFMFGKSIDAAIDSAKGKS